MTDKALVDWIDKRPSSVTITGRTFINIRPDERDDLVRIARDGLETRARIEALEQGLNVAVDALTEQARNGDCKQEKWNLVHKLETYLGCDCEAPYACSGAELVSNRCPIHVEAKELLSEGDQ